MNHFNQNYINAFNSAIKIFNESIIGCDDIIKLCKIANVPKMCSIDINKSILLADESIYECEQVSDHCKAHLKECKNDHCIKLCREIIDACAINIKTYEGIVLECQEQHMNACLDSITMCKDSSTKLINLIGQLLKIK